ncbi:transposase [Bradyrhizobium sp. ERR14]|nr:transposase [Bradyrhizobium sp. ERR14]
MFLIHHAGWIGGQHGWASLILWISASVSWPRLKAGCPAIRQTKQFGVAISTAVGWMQRVEETGSVEPGQMGGHKPMAVSGDHAVWLSRRIKDGDFTIRGLVAELAGRGLKVDYHSVWDFVHAEKLSFKKKRGGWRTRSTRGRAAASPVDKISRSRRS